MRMKNKKWSLPFLNEHAEYVYLDDTLAILKDDPFFVNKELYLEIGTGKGSFIEQMAKKYPKKYFLGVEKSATCLALTAKKIDKLGLKNVRLILGDIEKLIEYLPHNTFKGIFLNFSDPWPKKRHFKRRLTYQKFLEYYRNILVKNGQIFMKTDNVGLFEFSQEQLNANGFKITFLTYQYDGSDKFDAQTEYEEYFRLEGTNINRLIARKEAKKK